MIERIRNNDWKLKINPRPALEKYRLIPTKYVVHCWRANTNNKRLDPSEYGLGNNEGT